MSIQSLNARFGTVITIWRLAAVVGTSKKAMTQQGSTLKCFIQPMSATASQTAQLVFGRAFSGYVAPSTNILIGDQVRDPNGVIYDVQGTQNVNFGSQPFIQLTLQRQAQQGQL